MTNIYDIDKNELLCDHPEWIILQELLDYCENKRKDKVRYSELRSVSESKLNELSNGDRPVFGGVFENYIKNLIDKRLISRNRVSRKKSFIIPNIPEIKKFLDQEITSRPLDKLSSLEKEIVNNVLIVDTSIKILHSLSNNATTLDEIVNQSSSNDIERASENYKIFVQRTIKQFIENEIIRATDSDDGRNFRIAIDKIGEQLIDLLRSIEQYRISYASLIDVIKENFELPYPFGQDFNVHEIFEKISPKKLKKDAEAARLPPGISRIPTAYELEQVKKLIHEVPKRNWATGNVKKDVQQYVDYKSEADYIKARFAGLFLIALFSNYVVLLSNFGKNDFAINILTEIVMRAIKQHKSEVEKYFLEVEKSPRGDFFTNWIYHTHLSKYFTGGVHTNKVIRKEASKVYDSLDQMWQIVEHKADR